MTDSNKKNVISAKVSDETLSSIDETMVFLNIETRQELIKRAIDLYLSTFRFACAKTIVGKPFSQHPDIKMLFTANGDKKSTLGEHGFKVEVLSQKAGHCHDCGRFSTKINETKLRYCSKLLCDECLAKYDRSKPKTDRD